MAGPHRPHKLKTRYKFAYGIGHLQNDLTAALWFSFLLTYFVEVIGLSTAESGVLMLLGQGTAVASRQFSRKWPHANAGAC